MSRWKRFAISTAVTLSVLGGSTALWYQTHYVAPVVLPPDPPPPSPNGFDTLQQAKNLLYYRLPTGKHVSYWDDLPLTMRQKQELLVANKPGLEKIREALTQEYLVPQNIDPAHYSDSSPDYYSHRKLLDFAAETYAELGNFSEAMRCALDSMEVGVMVPRGGRFSDREAGNRYEEQGWQRVRSLAKNVDAKTARAAVARLERIEARRWPLAENLREELEAGNFARQLSVFRAGPVYVWEKMALDSATEADSATEKADTRRDFRALWQRAQAVYYGPRWLAYSFDDCVKRAQARFDSPWQPDRPDRIAETLYSIDGYRNIEMVEYFHRAECALLKTHLALCAYTREKNAPAQSLEELVAAGYLKAVPVDPFSPTRAPLGYNPDGTLWSIGPDAKDNGGDMFPKFLGQWRGQFSPGDIVED